MNEKLSAFVDNELSDIEERHLLAELGRDEHLRAAWGRYHLIRTAMRGEWEGPALSRLPDAVMQAIAREPWQRNWRRSAATFGKALGGLAVAASVAAIAILGLQSPGTPRQPGATVAQAPAAGVGARLTSADARSAKAAEALNVYLVEHSEFAPTAGMSNILPYVRSVSHEPSR